MLANHAAPPPAFVAALEHLSCPAAVTAGDEEVVWVNAAFADLLGLSPDDAAGLPLTGLLRGPGQPVGPGAHRHLVSDARGARRWLARSTGAAPEGHEVHVFADLTEFDSRRRARSAVLSGLEPARIDEETGVLTRRAALQELSAQVSRSRRYGNPLSAALVRFTDCGRLAEADVTDPASARRVAQCLNETLRWVDSIGVMERGELLVILPETGAGAAARVVEKIEGACAALGAGAPGSGLEVAVRAATWDRDDDVQALLARLREAPRAAA